MNIKKSVLTWFNYCIAVVIVASAYFGFWQSTNAHAVSDLSNSVIHHHKWENPITGEVIQRESSEPPIYITYKPGSTLGNYYGANKKFWQEMYKGEYLWYSPVPPAQLIESNKDEDRYQIRDNRLRVWGNGFNPAEAGTWFVDRTFNHNLKKGSYDIDKRWTYGYNGYNTGTTKIKVSYSYNNQVYNYIGKNYEWRYLGYSDSGSIVDNPYFPPEYPTEPDWHPSKKLWIWEPWRDFSSLGAGHYEESQRTTYDLSGKKSKWIEELFLTKNPEFVLEQKPGETKKQVYQRSANYWKDAILLKNNPEWSTGIARMYHNGNAPGKDGLWYMVFVLKTPDQPNLRVTDFKIIDPENGKVLGHVYRNAEKNSVLSTYVKIDPQANLKRGKEYKITARVKNMKIESEGKGKATTYEPLGLDLHLAYDDNVHLVGNYDESHYNELNHEKAGKSPVGRTSIEYLQTAGFEVDNTGAEWSFTVPEANIAKEEMKIRIEIPIGHYLAGENVISEDDFAEITLPIEKEDIGTLKTANLTEASGLPTEDIMPNTAYDLHFYVNKPFGETPVGDPNNLAANPFASLQVIVKNSEGSKVYNVVAEKTLYEGQTIQLTVKNVMSGNEPWLEAEWQIRQVHRDLLQSTVIENDGPYKQRWQSEVNIAVQNFELFPQVVYRAQGQPAGSENVKACYEVTNMNPKGDSRQIVHVITNMITGQKWTFDDVFVGNKEQKICKDLGTVNLVIGDNPFMVEVNPDTGGGRRWKEYLNNGNPYADNVDEQSILVVQNIAEQYCETVHTRNDWSQKYTKTRYYQTYKQDPIRDKDGDIIGWSAPYPYDEYLFTNHETVAHYESYSIEQAIFKSRDYDGNIMKNKGKIRAGYGFELEIDVNYQTNVDKTAPKPWNMGRPGEREDVYPLVVPVTMPEALYIEMPYTDKNGQPIRYKLEPIAIKGNWDDKTITYGLPQRDAFGKETNRRIYFNETVANGTYNIKVDTEAFYGYTPKTPVPFLLCDSANLSIEVLGSNADDVKSHVTQ
ncbi:hypothetical protein ABD91_25625 [Lysinibacillus sphaericus]|uniref:Athe_2463 domain-containing protein n=1 Tax=Lysinibacillus sphaericus TaxID=1421 RepID=UPI0018CE657D|nr:hypothetical protein [Lysinibacillus sphaericus]MBG9694124.1 hypothetical protein [Lysinibacillus sphaericus]